MDYQCILIYSIVNIKDPDEIMRTNAELRARMMSTSSSLDNVGRRLRSCFRRADTTAAKNDSVAPFPTINRKVITEAVKHAREGSVKFQEKKYEEAYESYRKATKLMPFFPDALCNLANILKEMDRDDAALYCYEEALFQCETHVDAMNNKANLRREIGEIEEAISLYKKAIDIEPMCVAARANLASILQHQGLIDEALNYYTGALFVKPGFADVLCNMGTAFKMKNDLEQARECFLSAIEADSNLADAYCNLGSLEKDLGNFPSACNYYNKALKLKPGFTDAKCNSMICKLAVGLWKDYDEEIKEIVECVKKQIKKGNIPSVHPHHSMLYPFSSKISKEIAMKHARVTVERARVLRKKQYKHRPEVKDRIRIGYVSSDFGNHPTSHLMQSIPGLHDRARFEIFCYALSGNDGTAFRSKIAMESDHFVDLTVVKKDHTAAKKILEDGIDILVNMNGYTKGARNEIFAIKPAPIQVMWLGYPGTSGASYMDYIISDKCAIPKELRCGFIEKVAYLNSSFMVGDHKQMFPHLKSQIVLSSYNCVHNDVVINGIRKRDLKTLIPQICGPDFNEPCPEEVANVAGRHFIPISYPSVLQDLIDGISDVVRVGELEIFNGTSISRNHPHVSTGEEAPDCIILSSRKQYGLPESDVVYCNFNQHYKITPDIFQLWMEILKAVPGSVLWLANFSLAEVFIEDDIKKVGVEKSRVIFSDVVPKEEHVRRCQLADICLDTVSCNGHTTTLDVLWAGVPVVTMLGKSLASRVTGSILTSMNCSDLIARDKAHYKEIAVSLGSDLGKLRNMREKCLMKRFETAAFDCVKYTRELEELYQIMCDRFVRGRRLRHIKLKPGKSLVSSDETNAINIDGDGGEDGDGSEDGDGCEGGDGCDTDNSNETDDDNINGGPFIICETDEIWL